MPPIQILLLCAAAYVLSTDAAAEDLTYEEILELSRQDTADWMSKNRERACLRRIEGQVTWSSGYRSGITDLYRWVPTLVSSEVEDGRPVITFHVLLEGVWHLETAERVLLPDRILENQIGNELEIPVSRGSPKAHVERAFVGVCRFYSVDSSVPFQVEVQAAPVRP